MFNYVSDYSVDYKKYVIPYLENGIKVELKQEDINKINNFVSKIIIEKQSEIHHIKDNNNEFKRFKTGFLGELALEYILNKKIIDYRVGNSNIFNVADLKDIGLNIGIKTVEYGKFPVIHKKPVRPEIINIKMNDNTIICLGVATVDVLQKYRNDNYILSKALKSRGTKTGFYGIKELIPINQYEELKEV